MGLESTIQEYLKHDISIIPVGKDKKPLIPSWREFQERRATEEEVDEWIKKYPDMQIAIVTGKVSSLIVVDIDKPDLDVSWLPETAMVQTGSGGFHYYYSWVEGVNNKARIKDFIDIRGEGGYVLAPPSRNLKGEYKWIKKMKPVFFPKNLFLKNEYKEKTSVQTEYQGFGEGQRNDRMAKYIGHLLAKIHPSEWEAIGYPVAEEANKKNTPPLPDRELQNIFKSICAAERRNDNERWYKQEPTCNLEIKTDYQKRYTWGTRGLDTSFAIIKRGNFIVLGAKGGYGKTTFAFDMAQKNSLLGHKVLFLSLEMDEKEIKDSVARKRAGITIEEEYDYNIPPYKQSLFNLKVNEIEKMENLFLKSVRRGGGLRWVEVLEIVYEYNDLDLIIIDNLDLIENEKGENDWDKQKRVVKKIMGFTSEKQIPIILIHHYKKTNKNDGAGNEDDLSGSKKISDGADRVVNISKNKDLEAVYPDKYKSTCYLQKGREYSDALKTIYFIKGTFVDEAPMVENYSDDLILNKA